MYFNASLSVKTWEKKTLVDPNSIYEKIFSSLQLGFSKIRFEFWVNPGLV